VAQELRAGFPAATVSSRGAKRCGIEKAGPVATITLNRPEALNAITPDMTAELHQALDAADADAEVRAIILTGAGRAFSAGYACSSPVPMTAIRLIHSSVNTASRLSARGLAPAKVRPEQIFDLGACAKPTNGCRPAKARSRPRGG